MTRLRFLPLVGAVAMLLFGATDAHAQTDAKMLVVSVEGAGVSAEERVQAQAVVEERLSHHPELSSVDTGGADIVDEMFELECFDLDDECLGKLARKYRTEHVLVLTLEREAGGYNLSIRLFLASSGRVESNFRRVDVARAELESTTRDGLDSLLGAPEPPKPQTGTVSVSANVPGAKVRIGAVAAGEAPFNAEVPVGTYPVEITKESYEKYVGRVTIVAGKTVTVRGLLTPVREEPVAAPTPAPVKPVPESPPEQKESRPLYKQWWFWTLVGAVVVGGTVATAVVLGQDDAGSPTGNLELSMNPGDFTQDPVFSGGP